VLRAPSKLACANPALSAAVTARQILVLAFIEFSSVDVDT
jgi:hypothetical protein